MQIDADKIHGEPPWEKLIVRLNRSMLVMHLFGVIMRLGLSTIKQMRPPVVNRPFGVSFCPNTTHNRQLFLPNTHSMPATACFYHSFVPAFAARFRRAGDAVPPFASGWILLGHSTWRLVARCKLD